LAEEGADLADKLNRAERKWDGLMKDNDYLRSNKPREWRKRGSDLEKQEEEARLSARKFREEVSKWEGENGVDVVGAWEAHNGKRWPNYRIDSGAPRPSYYVRD